MIRSLSLCFRDCQEQTGRTESHRGNANRLFALLQEVTKVSLFRVTDTDQAIFTIEFRSGSSLDPTTVVMREQGHVVASEELPGIGARDTEWHALAEGLGWILDVAADLYFKPPGTGPHDP